MLSRIIETTHRRFKAAVWLEETTLFVHRASIASIHWAIDSLWSLYQSSIKLIITIITVQFWALVGWPIVTIQIYPVPESALRLDFLVVVYYWLVVPFKHQIAAIVWDRVVRILLLYNFFLFFFTYFFIFFWAPPLKNVSLRLQIIANLNFFHHLELDFLNVMVIVWLFVKSEH